MLIAKGVRGGKSVTRSSVRRGVGSMGIPRPVLNKERTISSENAAPFVSSCRDVRSNDCAKV